MYQEYLDGSKMSKYVRYRRLTDPREGKGTGRSCIGAMFWNRRYGEGFACSRCSPRQSLRMPRIGTGDGRHGMGLFPDRAGRVLAVVAKVIFDECRLHDLETASICCKQVEVHRSRRRREPPGFQAVPVASGAIHALTGPDEMERSHRLPSAPMLKSIQRSP